MLKQNNIKLVFFLIIFKCFKINLTIVIDLKISASM